MPQFMNRKENNYKLVAFDMDGTLLQSNKTISDSVVKAVNKAIEQGKEVVISTGRCISELYEVFNKTPKVRYLITSNGALIYDNKEKKAIFHEPIPVDLVWKIFDIANKRDVVVHFLDYECILEKNKVDQIEQYGMGAYQPMYYEIALMVDDIRKYYAEHESPIQKINLYHKNNEEKEMSLNLLKKLDLTLTYSDFSTIECVIPSASKGKALKILCDYLDINLEEVIAVGDGFNDIPILKEAGLSVAMNNAVKEVKSVCDVIVSDNDHDGCKEVIEDYLLK